MLSLITIFISCHKTFKYLKIHTFSKLVAWISNSFVFSHLLSPWDTIIFHRLYASPNLWVAFVNSLCVYLMASCILPIVSTSAWTINVVPPRFVAVILIVLYSTKLKRVVGFASSSFTPCCRRNSCNIGLCMWNNNLIRFVSPYCMLWC
jgi:hypothetical protein